MACRQVRGRAASLSPKSRPKVHLPAQIDHRLPCACGEICSQRRAQCAKRTGNSMADASQRIAKPAPQSVALYLQPAHPHSRSSARLPPASTRAHDRRRQGGFPPRDPDAPPPAGRYGRIGADGTWSAAPRARVTPPRARQVGCRPPHGEGKSAAALLKAADFPGSKSAALFLQF